MLNQPLFNPTGGYASYIVPAAFMLILQQTLLMGAATLGGVAFEQGGRARAGAAAAAAVLGQGLAHLLLALPGRGAVPGRAAAPLRLLGDGACSATCWRWLLPFILSVSFLGQFVSAWFKRRETAVLLFIATSLPLFFLVGVAWPVEAIPPWLRAVSFVFPSTSAIDGLVRINQMGATLADVGDDWARLWILAALYLVLADLARRSFRPRRSGRCARVPRSAAIAGVAVLAVAAIGAIAPALPAATIRPPIAGMVRQTEIRIAPEITGRLASSRCRPGQPVRKGDLLAVLDNPELAASLGEAKAGGRRAQADRDHVYAGVRAEEVAILGAERRRRPRRTCCWREQENARAAALAARDFASRQQLDESTASLAKARGRSRPQARPARRRAAPARRPRSAPWRTRGSRSPRRPWPTCRRSSTRPRLVAPVDGVVGVLVAEPGEVVPVGKPVMTLDVAASRGSPSPSARTRSGGMTRRQRASTLHDERRPADRGARDRAAAARRVRHLARRPRRRRSRSQQLPAEARSGCGIRAACSPA